MVSLKKLFFLGVTLVKAFQVASPWSDDASLVARDDHAERNLASTNSLEDRQERNMLLQWTNKGEIRFLIGVLLPQALIDAMYAAGESSPGQNLLRNFLNFMAKSPLLFGPQTGGAISSARRKALYGVRGGIFGGDFGFQLLISPTRLTEMRNIIAAIKAWAQQGGVVVDVRQVAEFTAAPSRKRHDIKNRNTCPNYVDLLPYAKVAVPSQPDWTSFRVADECT
jgi:hypothetical protein